MSIAETHRRGSDKAFGSWPVTDDAGLVGVVRMTDVAAAVAAGRGDEMVAVLIADAAGDEKASAATAHVHPDQPLSLALSRMGETGHSVLPVVSRADVRKIVGIITIADILAVYGVAPSRELPPTKEGARASA
jgi:CBS domain-containing protein